jgi:glycosyltransferase involved in cell wall biosynthesis
MVLYAPGGFDARKNVSGLIEAYALLPAEVRAAHQLVIASSIDEASRRTLILAARNAGLNDGELVLTGYVPDPDLRALYSSAKLFVFPSKHEGFGLPALEAMACGAAVIGSSTTSVPEVIGLEEALFDPSSPLLIMQSMKRALDDSAMRDRLREHGRMQARKFSWDTSAQRALAAIKQRFGKPSVTETAPRTAKPRLAFVTPLPPERTGIANYSRELLPALLPHFDVKLVVAQNSVELPPELSSLPCHSAEWFAIHAREFDRIIYQFGNSPFHSHMFELLRLHPGVVVLHDFYLSGALAYEETSGNMPGVWSRALYESHGFRALQDRRADAEGAKRDYPCNLEVLQNAHGVIVHSEYSCKLARQWYGENAASRWTVIPHLRSPAVQIGRTEARAKLGLPEAAFIVCSFGFIDPTKQTLRLVDAWLASKLAKDLHCELILVGENHGGSYGRELAAQLDASGARIRITGWTDDSAYQLYLQAADACVQLRSSSRGETSGAVLHCLNHGLPTIVNANGSMADLADEAVLKLPDAFEDKELVCALEGLRTSPDTRAKLAHNARSLIRTRHSPAECARLYAEAIERFHENSRTDVDSLINKVADLSELPAEDLSLQQIARAIAGSCAEQPRLKQLLVDVSAVSRQDLRTGIERVVRAQLGALLKAPPHGWRVEPVALTSEGGTLHYRYARTYAARLLDIESPLADEPVDIYAGDVFYSPDLYPSGVIDAAHGGIYEDWRAHGVDINFLVHDILPLQRPEFFPRGAEQGHAAWLDCVARHSDRLVCISHAVATEVRQWLEKQEHPCKAYLQYAVIHHGADIEASSPSAGMPPDADRVVSRISAAPSYLMVGTIEPRKGHLQAISAFEQLWASGADVNLVIVGKEGWTHLPDEERRTIPQIVARLRSHPELGRRLFWLQGVSDEYLQRIYAACTAQLFASEGEGFGLPLIEGAQVGLPLIARDLPVFREIAGDHAFYFDGLDPTRIADAVREWMRLQEADRTPSVAGMEWRSWAQNAQELAAILLGDRQDSTNSQAGSDLQSAVVPVRGGSLPTFMEK